MDCDAQVNTAEATCTKHNFLDMNGEAEYSSVRGIEKDMPHLDASFMDAKTVQTIRGLVLDCCQQHGTGHGGRLTKSCRPKAFAD